MADIKDIILGVCPQVTFEDYEVLTAVVPDADWHAVAAAIHNAGYRWLTALIGEDFGDALGCVYYFTSTVDNSKISAKVTTTDRENPMIHSVSD